MSRMTGQAAALLLFSFIGGVAPTVAADVEIFTNGFETGNVSLWSSSAGAVPLEGFGEISDVCGILSPSNLDSAAPGFFVSALDFGSDPYDDGDVGLLTSGGQEILSDAGSSGSDVLVDVFSFEWLARCEFATLLKTEGEIEYLDPGGKKTDLLVEIDGRRIGNRSTRAWAWPPEDPYSVEQATDLLEGKLEDVLLSTANVSPLDAWQKQVLTVMAYGEGHASSLQTAWGLVSPVLTVDTLVIVIVTHGDDEFLY